MSDLSGRWGCRAFGLLLALLAMAPAAQAKEVALASPTATFCQNGFPIANAINGSFAQGNGWAIDPQQGNNQTAIFKTQGDLANPPENVITVRLYTLWGGQHNIGKFRLSATTSDRSTFGQGATCTDASPGGSAAWTPLFPQLKLSELGETLTVLGDGTIVASGTNPAYDQLTLTFAPSLTGITGFRLEVFADASLPNNGPGRAPNGNFVLTQLLIDAGVGQVQVPTLSEWALVLMALLLAGGAMWRLRSRS